MHNLVNTETIVALATASGIGAIAVIRLSGKQAIAISSKLFSKSLTTAKSHTIHFGQLSINKEIIDECLVSIFRSPKSYTKEDVVEISCHGSSYIVDRVIQACINLGARMANKGEFTLRAFLNGQLDLSQAEAVADLIASDSQAAHDIAIKQLRGGFSIELANLRVKLIDLASLLELELDFGEEDVAFASRDVLKNTLDELSMYIKKLITSFEKGNAIKSGIRTVIAGAPNAGKSTLLNALLNTDRAIVSEIPGTTRDTIEDGIIIDGIKYLLTDTAGLRESSDIIEGAGIKRSLAEIDKSQLLIYVLDVAVTNPTQIKNELSKLPLDLEKLIVVLNKMDLSPYTLSKDYASALDIKETNVIPVSAKNKMNIALVKEIMSSMVSHGLAEDGTTVTNSRHFDSLVNTQKSIDKALGNLKMNLSGDLIAMDLRHALYYIGEITGEVYTDDLLDNIFSNFCIGK